MEDERDWSRVLWRSRRGMLELDLLLVGFAREGYPNLDEAQQRSYREMLDVDDWVLLDWLRGRTEPESAFSDIVAAIAAFNAVGERGP